MSQINTYDFKACIHPKHGGDDYIILGSAKATSEADAKVYIRKYLARKSVVPDDFIITETKVG